MLIKGRQRTDHFSWFNDAMEPRQDGSKRWMPYLLYLLEETKRIQNGTQCRQIRISSRNTDDGKIGEDYSERTRYNVGLIAPAKTVKNRGTE